MRLHHIAYAVRDIESAEESFRALGYSPENRLFADEVRRVLIRFLTNKDGERVELVAPLDDASPVTKRLEDSRGVAHPYHLCFEVRDIGESVEKLRLRGFMRISSVAPAPAIDGKNVVFLMSKAGGLIELVEE